MVTVSVREVVLGLLLAVTVTVAGPDPPSRPTCSHDALLRAVHVHPAAVSTVTATEPPAAGVEAVVGATLNWQGGGGGGTAPPDWCTVKA
jgi:hypothetical protein